MEEEESCTDDNEEKREHSESFEVQHEHPWTTWKHTEQGIAKYCGNYIFTTVHVRNVLKFNDALARKRRVEQPLPSVLYPSAHLSQVADLEIPESPHMTASSNSSNAHGSDSWEEIEGGPTR